MSSLKRKEVPTANQQGSYPGAIGTEDSRSKHIKLSHDLGLTDTTTESGTEQAAAGVDYGDERDLDFDASFFEGTTHADVDLDAILRAVNEAPAVQEMDEAKARAAVARLNKAVATNSVMRSKYPDDPTKFMQSEVDVDEALMALKELAVAPQLYDLFISLGGCETLASLFTHENDNVHVSVLSLLAELINADALALDPANPMASRAAWNLVAEMIRLKIFPMMIQTAESVEPDEEDTQATAVFNCLSILEAVIEGKPSLAALFVSTTPLLAFLVAQVAPPHKPYTSDASGTKVALVPSHRLYASEVLLLVSVAAKTECQKVFARLNMPALHSLPPLSAPPGIDSIISKRKPGAVPWSSSECLTKEYLEYDEDEDEEDEDKSNGRLAEESKSEKGIPVASLTPIAKSRYGSGIALQPALKVLFLMVEPVRKVVDVHMDNSVEEELYLNVFNVIFAMIDDFAPGKRVILECYGLESLVMLAQRRNIFLAPALRLMEAMLQGSSLVARKLVDMGGLKTVFGLMAHLDSMFRAHKSLRGDRIAIEERLVGIALELMLQLSGDKRYQRVLAKLCEDNFAKCDILARMYTARRRAVGEAEARFVEGLAGLSADDRYAALSEGARYLRKLEHGWLVAQRAAALLALVLTAVSVQFSTDSSSETATVKQEDGSALTIKLESDAPSITYQLTDESRQLLKILYNNDMQLKPDIVDVLREYCKFVDKARSHLRFYANVMGTLADSVASPVFLEAK